MTWPRPPEGVRIETTDGVVHTTRDLIYDGMDGDLHQWIAIFPVEVLGELMLGRAHLMVSRLPGMTTVQLNTGLGPPPSITCPRCGATSYNGSDITEGYCGACHDWTSPPRHEA